MSLRLADESVDSLTSSQLLALQFKLGETFNIIDAKIRDREKSTSGVSFSTASRSSSLTHAP